MPSASSANAACVEHQPIAGELTARNHPSAPPLFSGLVFQSAVSGSCTKNQTALQTTLVHAHFHNDGFEMYFFKSGGSFGLVYSPSPDMKKDVARMYKHNSRLKKSVKLFEQDSVNVISTGELLNIAKTHTRLGATKPEPPTKIMEHFKGVLCD